MSDTADTNPYPSPAAELRSKVRAILSQVKPPMEIYEIRSSLPALQEEAKGHPVLLNPGDATLKNRELILLITLYGTLSPTTKSSFAPIIVDLMTAHNVTVVVATLVEIDYHLPQLAPIVAVPRLPILPLVGTTPLKPDDPYLVKTLGWSAIRVAISRRPYRFSRVDLARLERACAFNKDDVKKWLDRYPQGRDFKAELDRVDDMIQLAQYHRLSEELLETNPEINNDQHVLVTRMEELGFRRDIVEAIHSIDRKVHEAGKPVDFKAVMDLTRTIFEEIIEDAATKAAGLTNHPLPPPSANDFQPWNQLLMTLDVLSPKEGDVTQKLYNYFSVAGAHRLGTTREQVRVAKNTVIEWGMLIVGRVQGMK